MGEYDEAGVGEEEAPVSAADFLDKHGVDPRFWSQEFLEASELGDPSSLAQLLSTQSVDDTRALLRKVDQQGCTALLLFARKGNYEMVKILLDAGAILNDADNSGATSLHYAAGRGVASVVQVLLEFGADCNKLDDRSETPLMWARSKQIVELPLEAGADPSAKNVSGQTALLIAGRNGNEDLINVLANLPGQDLDVCDSQGCSAHALAISAGNHDAAELLASLGAKVVDNRSSRIIRREDALLEAARRGNAEACTGFLQSGVDIEVEVCGDTALLIAAGSACSRVVEKLLHGRADPNHADPFMGETPLIRAVLSQGSNEMLWMLLEAKADPARQDMLGRTAADVATAWSYSEAADILKAAAAGELTLGTMD